MSQARILGISGNLTRPSKTSVLVKAVLEEIYQQGLGGAEFYDLLDADPETFLPGVGYGSSNWLVEKIEQADVLVVGSPVYKGSYTGLLKHLFDQVHPDALHNKPVLLAATGASHSQALVIDHQLRPLFAFFRALIIPTGIFLNAGDGDASDAIREHLQRTIRAAVKEIPPLSAEVQMREFAFVG